MRSVLEKFRLLGWLALVVVTGFLVTGLSGYRVARDAVHHTFAAMSVPATSDLVHAEIHRDIQRLVLVSSLIAGDAFVRNWLAEGERNPDQMARYLKDANEKYGTTESFVVSERSRRYYQEDGTLKGVPPGDSRDAWFFRVSDLNVPAETRVNPDLTHRNTILVSSMQRIVDEQGKYLGVSGVGLPLNVFSRLIEKYQTRFGCRIYFVDNAGFIMLGGKSVQHLRDLPRMRPVATSILSSGVTPTQTSYRLGEATVLVNTRHIPELNWFLVVEQSDWQGIQPVQRALLVNLAIGILVIGIVLGTVLTAFNRYRERLANAAAVDPLTGLINRSAFEFVYQQTILETDRTREPLSLILCEIDGFRRVKNLLGGQMGENVLQNMAQLARKSVRASDPVVRWSGDQFVIQLRGCPLERALEVAERLRISVAAHDFHLDDPRLSVTVSLGVAVHEHLEEGSNFLQRTSQALGSAKTKGGNRAESDIYDNA